MKRLAPSPRVNTNALAKAHADVPIFLLKTHDMLENTPRTIAEWSQNGKAFMIKRPKELAAQILPKYFKHNNFSSFVRQLNFYGFRKHKKENILVVKSGGHSTTGKNYWEFFHEHFTQYELDQMALIKRKTYSDMTITAEKEELQELKSQITDLTSQVAELKESLQVVLNMVQPKNNEEQTKPVTSISPQVTKKRKIASYDPFEDDFTLDFTDPLFAELSPLL